MGVLEASMFLILATMPLTTAAANTTETPTVELSSATPMTTCDTVKCKNRRPCAQGVCDCGYYLSGDDCATFAIRKPQLTVGATDATLTLLEPTTLIGYTVIYFRNDKDEVSRYAIADENITVISVAGLKPDGYRYVICVMRDDTLSGYTDDAQLVEDIRDRVTRTDCGSVVTQYSLTGPYTLAAVVIAGAILLLLALLYLCKGEPNTVCTLYPAFFSQQTQLLQRAKEKKHYCNLIKTCEIECGRDIITSYVENMSNMNIN